jgi:hypothetical protein
MRVNADIGCSINVYCLVIHCSLFTASLAKVWQSSYTWSEAETLCTTGNFPRQTRECNTLLVSLHLRKRKSGGNPICVAPFGKTSWAKGVLKPIPLPFSHYSSQIIIATNYYRKIKLYED